MRREFTRPTVDGGFALAPKGGQGPEVVWDAGGIWRNSFYGGVSDRNTENYQLDGSYFFNTGNLDHELQVFGKAGACLVLCGLPDFKSVLPPAVRQRIPYTVVMSGLSQGEVREFVELAQEQVYVLEISLADRFLEAPGAVGDVRRAGGIEADVADVAGAAQGNADLDTGTAPSEGSVEEAQ